MRKLTYYYPTFPIFCPMDSKFCKVGNSNTKVGKRARHMQRNHWDLFVCLFAKEPLLRGCGRGPLYEVPVSHSSSKVGIHPPL